MQFKQTNLVHHLNTGSVEDLNLSSNCSAVTMMGTYSLLNLGFLVYFKLVGNCSAGTYLFHLHFGLSSLIDTHNAIINCILLYCSDQLIALTNVQSIL